MLEIKENPDKSGYSGIKGKNGDFHVTEALENGKVTGFIAYAYENDRTVIYDYDDGKDLMLCDGLVRFVMLKSLMKNIETVFFDIPESSKYDNLKKLGFISGESKICGDIDSFMDSCGSCRHGK